MTGQVFGATTMGLLFVIAAAGLVRVFVRAAQLRHLHPKEFGWADKLAVVQLGLLLLSVLAANGGWWVWSKVAAWTAAKRAEDRERLAAERPSKGRRR